MVICLERGADFIWPSWCHCHSLSLASVKSRLVLPFWYRLTWVVPEKGPLNGCVCDNVMQYYQQSHSRAIFLTWYSVGKILLTMLFWPTGGKKLVLAVKKTISARTVFSNNFLPPSGKTLPTPAGCCWPSGQEISVVCCSTPNSVANVSELFPHIMAD